MADMNAFTQCLAEYAFRLMVRTNDRFRIVNCSLCWWLLSMVVWFRT